ncbi:hypothetical protein ABH920_005674 [Catenulispora sp. EB89]|uniref:hypothetical protein n=1 Tax=Catenulispora sp. EB89 TaxID=3156257 RepID=UPI0035114E11
MHSDSGDEATDRPPINADLWARLLAGNCTRVVVLSPPMNRSIFELYLPQTLGLKPLRLIEYSRRGDLATTATSLAATDRWIAEGEEWAPHFLPRATAILSIETHRVTTMAIRLAYPGLGTTRLRFRQARARHHQRKSNRTAGPAYLLDTALNSPRLTTNRDLKPPTLTLAEEHHAAKLIRITSNTQVRALRKVRAGTSEQPPQD